MSYYIQIRLFMHHFPAEIHSYTACSLSALPGSHHPLWHTYLWSCVHNKSLRRISHNTTQYSVLALFLPHKGYWINLSSSSNRSYYCMFIYKSFIQYMYKAIAMTHFSLYGLGGSALYRLCNVYIRYFIIITWIKINICRDETSESTQTVSLLSQICKI